MKKNKHIFFITIISFVVMLTSFGIARAEATSTIRQILKTENKTIRAGLASTTNAEKNKLANDIKVQQTAAKAQMQQNRIQMISNLFNKQVDRVEIRLGATIDRIQNIMGRVNSRIEKIKNAGGNTSAAENYTSEAQTSLTLAQTSFASLQSEASSTTQTSNITASSTTALLKNLRGMAQDVQKNLGQSQKYLEQAVGSLKNSSGNATTTKSN